MHDVSEVHTHNGWANKETWLVNMWLNDNQLSHQMLQKICKQDVDPYLNATELEGLIWEQFEEQFESNDMWRDMMSSCLARVQWIEVIEKNKV